MFPRHASDITDEHILQLIENNVLEGKALEYKRELSMDYDGHPEKFLAETTSFANSRGGHLVIGLAEEEGEVEFFGLDLDDTDAEISRWEGLLQNCVQPRLPGYEIVAVPVEDQHVIVVQVFESTIGPHRVERQSLREFYGRSSNGKYPLEVEELRESFLLSDRRARDLKEFRAQRIGKVRSRATPVPIPEGPATVLHLVPYDAFAAGPRIDPSEFIRSGPDLPPFNRETHGETRPNLDGVISPWTGSLDDQYWCYTQLYRNGAIEAVDTFRYTDEDNRLPIGAIREDLERVLPEYMAVFEHTQIQPPVFLFMSILDAKGYEHPQDHWGDYHGLDRNVANFPELVIEEITEDPEEIIEELISYIMNSLGALTSTD